MIPYLAAGLVLVAALAAFLWRRANDIHVVARTGWTNRLRRLLNRNPGLARARDANGETPVHQAAKHGALETLALLLDRGGEVDAATPEGATPLHFAAAFGEVEATRLLLKRGAKADLKEETGLTPIMMAQAGSFEEIVRLLKEAGADAQAVPPIGVLGGGHYITPMDPADPLLEQSRRRAQETLDTLLSLFREHPRATMVKVSATTDSGSVEKVWADLLEVQDERVRVRIRTLPVSGKLPPGPVQDFARHQIEDWQVELPDGRIRGGFGYEVLFQRTREKLGRLPRELAENEPRFVDHRRGGGA